MPQCKAFGCFNRQGVVKKSFFSFPNPAKSTEDRKTCSKWLQSLKNASLPWSVTDYVWRKSHIVCEDHFEPNCFSGVFANQVAASLNFNQKKKALKKDAVPTIIDTTCVDLSTGFAMRSKQRQAYAYGQAKEPGTKRQRTYQTIQNKRQIAMAKSSLRKGSCSSTMIDSASTSALTEQSGPLPKRKRQCSESNPVTSTVSLPNVHETENDAVQDELSPSTTATPVVLNCGHQCITCMQLSQSTRSASFLATADHCYYNAQPDSCKQQASPVMVHSTPVKNNTADESRDFVHSPVTDTADGDISFPDDPFDGTFCTNDDIESNDSDCSLDMPSPGSFVEEKKYVVFDSCLNNLFSLLRCQECGLALNVGDVVKDTSIGMQLKCKFVCERGHTFQWCSQPTIGKMPVGNLLSCAATLFCGQTCKHIAQYASFLNLNFYSDKTFYSIQTQFLIPTILGAWKSMQHDILQQLRERNMPLRVAGDGRCDSPGFSAKYCTYSLIDISAETIIAFVVIDVTETGSSCTMETKGFIACMEYLFEAGFHIEVLATDRHVQIRSTIQRLKKECQPQWEKVDHQFDVWHLANSLKKKLCQKAKLKENETLFPWIKAIVNHLWWSSANCSGDPDLLEEMWKSLVHHISGTHQFEGILFKTCAHKPYSSEEEKKKKWLKKGTKALDALKQVVLDKRLVADIRKLSQFCHTGSLEVYHSLMTKYVPKRQAFDKPVMEVRTCLAAIDHNNSLGRQQKISSKTGEKCFKIVFPKGAAQWVAKPRYEDKTYEWVFQLMEAVVDRAKEQSKNAEKHDHLQRKSKGNIAKVPAPLKADVIAKHLSRFQIIP